MIQLVTFTRYDMIPSSRGDWTHRGEFRSRSNASAGGPSKRRIGLPLSRSMAASGSWTTSMKLVPSRPTNESHRTFAIQTNPIRTAQTAACVRSVTPIFRRMCCTCTLTVS